MSVSRVPLKLMQGEAEGYPLGRRYSLISWETMSWIRSGTGVAPLCEHHCESYFSCVIASKKVKLKDLEGYESKLLTVTPEEEALGFKYVFQTRLTKATVNERLRGPMGLFDPHETFIDNNMQQVFDRLHEYYD